nr:hypothetical protein [Spirochaetia bacterium]
DLLLFLINRNVKFFDKYNKVKISGTTNMAKAFCKVVAYSKDFKTESYLSDSGILYEKLEDLLDKVQTGELNKESINNMVDNKKCIQYKEKQSEHYKKLINSLLFD